MKFIRMIWPSITDIESANNASRYCYFTVWGLSLLSTVNLVISYVLLTKAFRQVFPLDKAAFAFIGIMLFALVGYFVKRNSKIAVFIPVLMMLIFGTGPNIVVGMVQLYHVVYLNDRFRPLDYGSWYGIASACVLLLLYVNGIRGVFAYHKFVEKALYQQRLNDDGRWAF